MSVIDKPTRKSSETSEEMELSPEKPRPKLPQEKTGCERQEKSNKQNKLIRIKQRLQKLIKSRNYSQMAI